MNSLRFRLRSFNEFGRVKSQSQSSARREKIQVGEVGCQATALDVTLPVKKSDAEKEGKHFEQLMKQFLI